MNKFRNAFDYICETGSLMVMKRSHSRSLINTFDTVASHSHHAAIIAYIISRFEKLSHEEGLKAMAMAVLHDNPETRVGDFDFITKHYAQKDEELAFENQVKDLEFKQDLTRLYTEYEERETLVSKCAKDADTLQQMYLQWVLAQTGNSLAGRWLKGDKKERIPYLRTKSAKRLALFFYDKKLHYHTWWWKDMVEKGINQKHLNSVKPKP